MLPDDSPQSEPAPDITGATIIARSPSVLTSEVDGEIIMMSIGQGRYFGLNDIASDIWQRIDPPRAFDDLVDQLAAAYSADRATIAADVLALLGEMLARNVVVLD